ncbi:hypothetical protein [Solibacillus sp. CAU 1738]
MRLPALPKKRYEKESRFNLGKWRERLVKRWFPKKPFFKVPARKK